MGSLGKARRAALWRVCVVIFVTVGAQMPFDRLIRAVDDWATSRAREDVFAQIGPSDFCPKSIRTTRFLDPREFRNRVQEADVIVAHAGMGSLITALEYGKPIIAMPRRGDLRETRNDHQIATASRLSEQGRIVVALDERQLVEKLDEFEITKPVDRILPYASPRLVATLRSFIEGASDLLGAPADSLPSPKTIVR
jgi:UDP-N-acetylglucosamine transferase subunit ALG13